MSEVVVKLSDVKEGALLIDDVYKNTTYPIVRKGTHLTEEHLNILRLFAIEKIKVGNTSSTTPDHSKQTEKTTPVQHIDQPTIQTRYEKAVAQMKKEFRKWQSGISPDIATMRSIIVPLLEQIERPERDLAFLTVVATKKEYIYHHAIAVGLLAYAIGKEMKLSSGENIQLAISGMVMDCGMTRLPPTILSKEGPLTTKEYNEVKKHPIYSYQMINESSLLRTEMKLAILQHHERLDGSGYPRQEKQANITLYAQILGIADVYHARTSERIYRSKESPYKVLEALKTTYSAFNIKVINALYEVAGRLSIGTKVKLSNGEQGIIVYIHAAEPFRPTVKLTANDTMIELTKQRNLSIEEVITR